MASIPAINNNTYIRDLFTALVKCIVMVKLYNILTCKNLPLYIAVSILYLSNCYYDDSTTGDLQMHNSFQLIFSSTQTSC